MQQYPSRRNNSIACAEKIIIYALIFSHPLSDLISPLYLYEYIYTNNNTISAAISSIVACTRDSFDINATILILQKRNEAENAYLEGKEQLDVLKRQAVLGHLYPTARSVMETA